MPRRDKSPMAVVFDYFDTTPLAVALDVHETVRGRLAERKRVQAALDATREAAPPPPRRKPGPKRGHRKGHPADAAYPVEMGTSGPDTDGN